MPKPNGTPLCFDGTPCCFDESRQTEESEEQRKGKYDEHEEKEVGRMEREREKKREREENCEGRVKQIKARDARVLAACAGQMTVLLLQPAQGRLGGPGQVHRRPRGPLTGSVCSVLGVAWYCSLVRPGRTGRQVDNRDRRVGHRQSTEVNSTPVPVLQG